MGFIALYWSTSFLNTNVFVHGVEARGQHQASSSVVLHLSFEIRSLTKPRARLPGWLASKLQTPPVLCLPQLRLQMAPPYVTFTRVPGEESSGPGASTSVILEFGEWKPEDEGLRDSLGYLQQN